jgi:OmpA-OmpF porin, OOP family
VNPAVSALFVGLLVATSGGVLAQAGPYVGGALGQSKLKEWCTGETATTRFTGCDDSDTSWKLLGGYRFNGYVAVEASYIEWGKVSARFNTGAQVAAKQHSYGLAAVGTVPLGERFELFGKAGFLKTEQETRRITPNPLTVNRDETEFHYGLGAKYAFTTKWAVRGEWEKTDNLKAEMLSIGVEYRF